MGNNSDNNDFIAMARNSYVTIQPMRKDGKCWACDKNNVRGPIMRGTLLTLSKNLSLARSLYIQPKPKLGHLKRFTGLCLSGLCFHSICYLLISSLVPNLVSHCQGNHRHINIVRAHVRMMWGPPPPGPRISFMKSRPLFLEDIVFKIRCRERGRAPAQICPNDKGFWKV